MCPNIDRVRSLYVFYNYLSKMAVNKWQVRRGKLKIKLAISNEEEERH